MGTKELESKIRELRELQSLIDKVEKECDGIREMIKAVMGDSEEIRAGEYKVTWETVESSKLDVAAF